ncbi:hypothetical protein Hdeb2414_s0007g00256131 [Helianthus debilis subsp. tardiflorus]
MKSKKNTKTCFIKRNYEMSITHNSHEHPLIFVDSRCNNVTKFEDLCNGCDTQIMAMSFYRCVNDQCKFVLQAIQHFADHDIMNKIPLFSYQR